MSEQEIYVACYVEGPIAPNGAYRATVCWPSYSGYGEQWDFLLFPTSLEAWAWGLARREEIAKKLRGGQGDE